MMLRSMISSSLISPAIGEALAEQVIDGKSKIDMSSFSMKRFADLIR
jgi:glycine/D-amino acid oxidase-like deaminating enzyme